MKGGGTLGEGKGGGTLGYIDIDHNCGGFK